MCLMPNALITIGEGILWFSGLTNGTTKMNLKLRTVTRVSEDTPVRVLTLVGQSSFAEKVGCPNLRINKLLYIDWPHLL